MNRNTGDLTIYYNGSCPICATEIEHYRKVAARAELPLDLVDVANGTAVPEGYGHEEMLKRLHVRDGAGRMHAGVDAFTAIWSALPGWTRMARLTSMPVIRPVAEFVYDRILAPLLFAWHRRRMRLATEGSGCHPKG